MGKYSVLLLAMGVLSGSVATKIDESRLLYTTTANTISNLQSSNNFDYGSIVDVSTGLNLGYSANAAVGKAVLAPNLLISGTTGYGVVTTSIPVATAYTTATTTSQPIITTTSATVNSTSTPLAGGYKVITNINSNKEALAALNYVKSSTNILSSAKLIQASSQVVNGFNYQFIFQIDYSGSKLQYVVVVYKPIQGDYQIIKSQYTNLTQPSTENYKHVDNVKNAAYIDKIDGQLRSKFKDITSSSQISDVDVCAPYYIVKYNIDPNTLLRAELSYDAVRNSVNVYSSSKQTIEKVKTTSTTTTSTNVEKVSVPISVSKSTLAKYGLSTDGISFSDILPYDDKVASGFYDCDSSQTELYDVSQAILDTVMPQIQKIDSSYKVLGTKFKVQQKRLTLFITYIIRSQKSMQSVYITVPNTNVYDRFAKYTPGYTVQAVATKPTQPVVTAPQPTKPIQPVQPTTPTVIQHETTTVITKPYVPTYTISNSNDKLLGSVSGISDPALIPFLTGTYADTLDNKQIDVIMQYLIKKVGITTDFSIVLVNQIKYGIRFVIQTADHKLFQAVVTSDNKSPQLLSWQRIGVISDVNPDVFSYYYKIDTDEDLKSLLQQVFKGNDAISKFKQIINCEKKISFDGVYYRMIIESTSGNKFLIVFYYVPDKKYNEILQYELLDNGFDAKKETTLYQIPQNDNIFNIAKSHLYQNYGNVLSSADIAYISFYDNNPYKYYRFAFAGLNGKYEAVETVNAQNLNSMISRWEKLQGGYVPVDLGKLDSSPEYKSVKSSVQSYIKTKFGFDASPNYLQLKSVPGVSGFYKFTFDKPFPFTLTLEEKEQDHSLSIRGMQRIPIAPANEYYNDRVFAGYSCLNLNELQYDDVYQAFYTQLLSKTSVTAANSECKSAFRLKTPLGIYYKALYSVNSKLYLASYSYEFLNSQYQLNSFQPYESVVEPGDYRWKCLSVDGKTKTCQKCDTNTILTSGRCYSQLNACSYQIASTCKVCNAGYTRVNHACEKPSYNTVPEGTTNTSTSCSSKCASQTVTTALGPQTIVFNTGNDPNCLVYRDSVCQQCSYRYFISNGICKKAQDQCQLYDQQTGLCYRCSSGYYLSKGACIQLDPLCAEANSDGYCTACYKNYVNIQGKCYIQSNINLTPSSAPPKDQLCIQWAGDRCTKCQYGTFYSKQTGLCTIQDPFCQQFDEDIQECTICQRGFNKTGPNKCQRAY